jgi:hypothetical protein
LRDRTVKDLKTALENQGVEFTNGGQPGVRLRAVDVAAVELAAWGPWQMAANDGAAVLKIRREWPGLLGQSYEGVKLFFLAPMSDVRVAEAEPGEMGGSWRYRTKPRILEPMRARSGARPLRVNSA